MKAAEKLKNRNVAGKINYYRFWMIGLMVAMGVISAVLSIIMYAKVKEITEVWSPSLSCVQELNGLTSDYRLKQYGHLVAETTEKMADYEQELEDTNAQIDYVSASFQKLISTEVEKEQYDNIVAKWDTYTQQSEEILNLSRSGKTAEAGEMMVGEVYDTYKDFSRSFDELETYENNELNSAKVVVKFVFITMLVIILLMSAFAVVMATSLGRVIIKLIIEPVRQIEEAIGGMRMGDLAKSSVITYESEDELGTVAKKLKESMHILYDYIQEISDSLREIAKGDLTKDGEVITDFLGDFSSIKESLIFILKRFNSTLTEIQNTAESVASDSEQIANASQQLSEGATDQASAIEELTATVCTVSGLAEDSAKATQTAYNQVKSSVEQAEIEKQQVVELTKEMAYITEISKEIENIITAIEDIASQTNLLSLNASIEAARAGEAGKGFAVVADQIGKLASDSAQSAVDTRELISKTLVEIEKGNAIALSTAAAFEDMIANLETFADLSQQTTENVHAQATALEQVEQGIEQISGAMQNTAAASEENTAISANLSSESAKLDELVQRFKLF